VVVYLSWGRDIYKPAVIGVKCCCAQLQIPNLKDIENFSCQLLTLERGIMVFLCLQPAPSFFKSFFPTDQVFRDASRNSCLAPYWSHKLPLTPSSWTCNPQTCSHQGWQRNKVRLRNPNYTYKHVGHQGNLKNV